MGAAASGCGAGAAQPLALSSDSYVNSKRVPYRENTKIQHKTGFNLIVSDRKQWQGSDCFVNLVHLNPSFSNKTLEKTIMAPPRTSFYYGFAVSHHRRSGGGRRFKKERDLSHGGRGR